MPNPTRGVADRIVNEFVAMYSTGIKPLPGKRKSYGLIYAHQLWKSKDTHERVRQMYIKSGRTDDVARQMMNREYNEVHGKVRAIWCALLCGCEESFAGQIDASDMIQSLLPLWKFPLEALNPFIFDALDYLKERNQVPAEFAAIMERLSATPPGGFCDQNGGDTPNTA